MTAYALLTYTLLGDVATALPVVKWLSQQRNALGGFSSTQVCQAEPKGGLRSGWPRLGTQSPLGSYPVLLVLGWLLTCTSGSMKSKRGWEDGRMWLRDGGGRLWDRDQPLLLWRCAPASWGPQLCGCLHQICSPFQPHESLATVRVHGTPSLGQTSGTGGDTFWG